MPTSHERIPDDLLPTLMPDERICYEAALTESGFVGDVDTLVVASLYRVALSRKLAADVMAPNHNRPVPMKGPELVSLLENILEVVKAGDSFEGSFEYMMPSPGDDFDEHGPEEDIPDFMVRGAIRTGNSMGQGGISFIGSGPG